MACGCRKNNKKTVTKDQMQSVVFKRLQVCKDCKHYVGPKKIPKLKDLVISIWAKDKPFLGKWPKCGVCRCLIDFKTRLVSSGGCPKKLW